MTDTADNRIQPFNADVAANNGYLYTTNARLSSVLANQRLTQAALSMVDFRGKRVLDIGCGDGAYSIDLYDSGHPALMHGVDPAREAVRIAEQRKGSRRMSFAVASAETLPYETNSFDLAHIRGVLHHMQNPVDALREALRVAAVTVVIEPNGYNPGLKLLERLSRYHIEHGERSYAPLRLHRWVRELGGRVNTHIFAGFVPFFCPDLVAKSLKRIEPVLEATPLARAVGCAVYVFTMAHGGPDL